MNVVVDPLLCNACGICVELCPEVFEMGIEAAEVMEDPVPLDLMDLVHEAEESCPVEAISHT